jgi:hypothetical protein
MCRECIRLEGWDSRVALNRVADHYIFKVRVPAPGASATALSLSLSLSLLGARRQVEAVGMLSPREIVKEAIGVLKEKCELFLRELDQKDDEADAPVAGTVDGEDIEGML